MPNVPQPSLPTVYKKQTWAIRTEPDKMALIRALWSGSALFAHGKTLNNYIKKILQFQKPSVLLSKLTEPVDFTEYRRSVSGPFKFLFKAISLERLHSVY